MRVRIMADASIGHMVQLGVRVRGIGNRHCMLLYFDLNCFAWQDIQPTALQLFLRYSVEIYKCKIASELIS